MRDRQQVAPREWEPFRNFGLLARWVGCNLLHSGSFPGSTTNCKFGHVIQSLCKYIRDSTGLSLNNCRLVILYSVILAMINTLHFSWIMENIRQLMKLKANMVSINTVIQEK